MVFYYCTCTTDKKQKRAQAAGRTPFREVIADSEGICKDCGYYAVAYFDRIDPTRIKLYDKLYNMGIDEPPINVVGGASLQGQIESKKRRELSEL